MYDIRRFVGRYGYNHLLYRSDYYLYINGSIYCGFSCAGYEAWTIQTGKYKYRIFKDNTLNWYKCKKADLILRDFHVYKDHTIYTYNMKQIIDKVSLSISIVHE